MAYQTLNENFYRCNSCGPLGLQLALQYDRITGDYRLIEKNALGIGSAIFYQNGVYYSDAIRDTNLFTNQDPKQLTPAGVNLSSRIRTEVNTAYIRFGGLNKGNKINDSAKTQNISGKPAVINAVPGATPGIAGAVPALSNPNAASNIAGNIVELFKPGLPSVGEFAVPKNPAALGPNSVLKYPKDIIDTYQDTLHITQFEYQSPNIDIFKTGISDILNKGVQRGRVAAQKNLKGKVILPIPNNPQDSNSVAWGPDNMDAVTTAMTAQVIQQPGPTTAGLASATIGQEIANAMNQPGLADIIGKSPAFAARLMLLAQGNTAATKAAFYSLLLSRLQFDVSPESILSRGLGVVPNSNLQLLFNNVTLRGFNFSYMMTPRSEAEAKDVNMILRFFKQGMAARKDTLQAGGASLFLKTPNVFKLEYKTTGNKSIAGMNKFKICAMTGFGVNYAPNGQWSAYKDGQPSSVIMTMGFNEIEPIYANDYQETSGDITFDLPSVGPNDIGY